MWSPRHFHQVQSSNQCNVWIGYRSSSGEDVGGTRSNKHRTAGQILGRSVQTAAVFHLRQQIPPIFLHIDDGLWAEVKS